MRRKDGRSSRLYEIWLDIKKRICDEWRTDFAAFARYVAPDPGPGYELGRIDNDLGYQPGNVGWETKTQNARNRRTTHWVEYKDGSL
jgi:hypothetical protein